MSGSKAGSLARSSPSLGRDGGGFGREFARNLAQRERQERLENLLSSRASTYLPGERDRETGITWMPEGRDRNRTWQMKLGEPFPTTAGMGAASPLEMLATEEGARTDPLPIDRTLPTRSIGGDDAFQILRLLLMLDDKGITTKRSPLLNVQGFM